MREAKTAPGMTAGGAAQTDRILRSAEKLFRSFGYGKTTVADIAHEAGISTAYLYRFFPAKLAICEAVCSQILARLTSILEEEVASTFPPADKLRRIYERLTQDALRLLFDEERLLEIVRVGLNEDWAAVAAFKLALADAARRILTEGTKSGRFRPLPNLEGNVQAVAATFMLCVHPVMLEQSLKDDPMGRARQIAILVLDGLNH